MATAFQMIEVMLLILLGVVGAMVMWLHFRLNQMAAADHKLPLLSERLEKAMKDALRGVRDMKSYMEKEAPKVDDKVAEANRTLNDLSYMLDRAEKILARLDGHNRPAVSAPAPAAPKSSSAAPLSGRVDYDVPKQVVRESMDLSALGGRVESRAEPKGMPPLEEPVRRMASPKAAGQAYGAAASQAGHDAAVSEAEQELRQALKGRL